MGITYKERERLVQLSEDVFSRVIDDRYFGGGTLVFFHEEGVKIMGTVGRSPENGYFDVSWDNKTVLKSGAELELPTAEELREYHSDCYEKAGFDENDEKWRGIQKEFRKKDFENDFTNKEFIDHGSYRDIFTADRISDGKKYVMKASWKSMFENNPKHRMQTKHERAALSELLECPWIVRFHGAYQTNKKCVLVLDYINTGTLQNFIDQELEIEDSSVRFFLCEILCALEEFGNLQLLHGDLTTDNIMIGSDGHIILVDLGSVVSLDRRSGVDRTTPPHYAAPEMILSEMPHADHETFGNSVDHWSFGVIAFKMFCRNKFPFGVQEIKDASWVDTTLGAVLHDDLQVPDFVSEEGKSLLSDVLQKGVENRLGSERGIAEIMEHSFFEGIDWEQVRTRNLKPVYFPEPKKRELEPGMMPISFSISGEKDGSKDISNFSIEAGEHDALEPSSFGDNSQGSDPSTQ